MEKKTFIIKPLLHNGKSIILFEYALPMHACIKHTREFAGKAIYFNKRWTHFVDKEQIVW